VREVLAAILEKGVVCDSKPKKEKVENLNFHREYFLLHINDTKTMESLIPCNKEYYNR